MTLPTLSNGEQGLSVRAKLNAILKESVSIFHYIPSNQWAAIQAGTSTYDILGDITTALADKPSAFPSTIVFPYGLYKCSGPIEIKKPVRLISEGSGLAGTVMPTIQFTTAGGNGITINRSNTLNGGIETPSTTGADGAVISGIRLKGTAGASAGFGLWLRARAFIENVAIEQFAGNGMQIIAASGGTDATIGNANNFQVLSCTFRSNGGHGVIVDGADANSGVITGCSSSLNGGCGFFDSSFLGNTYVGCHTEANGDAAYKSDNANARNVFVGCYSESGQPASDIRLPSLVVGGLHAAGFTAQTKGYLTTDGSAVTAGTLRADSSLVATVLQMNAATNAWRMQVLAGTDDMKIDWANQGTGLGIYFSGSSTALGVAQGRSLPNACWLPKLCIGLSSPRRIESASVEPSTGDWAKGDIVFNSNPSAGGTVGWICTTTGTAGSTAVFKTFGSISA